MLTMAVEMLFCVGIVAWLLRQKRGEKFSANFILKLILAGMIPVVIPIALDGVLPDTSAMAPLLYGFLKALFIAACVEELLIYLAFRIAIRGSVEVKSVHDAVLAALQAGYSPFSALWAFCFLCLFQRIPYIFKVVTEHIFVEQILGHFVHSAFGESVRFFFRQILKVLCLIHPGLNHAFC